MKDYTLTTQTALRITNLIHQTLKDISESTKGVISGNTIIKDQLNTIPDIQLEYYIHDSDQTLSCFENNSFCSYTREWENVMAVQYSRSNPQVNENIAHEVFHYCEYHILQVTNSNTYYLTQRRHISAGKRFGFNCTTMRNDEDFIDLFQYGIQPRELMANYFAMYYSKMFLPHAKTWKFSRPRDDYHKRLLKIKPNRLSSEYKHGLRNMKAFDDCLFGRIARSEKELVRKLNRIDNTALKLDDRSRSTITEQQQPKHMVFTYYF